MCSWKKALIAALVVVGVVFVARNTWVGSHVRLWWQQMAEAAQEAVTPEQELERLKMELTNLEDEDKRLVHEEAKQERAIEKLTAEITSERARLKKMEANLKELHEALKATGPEIVLHGEPFSRESVEKEIKADFLVFEKAEQHLKSRQAHLVELKKGLEACRAERREYAIQRQEMGTELEKLATLLKEERRASAQEGKATGEAHRKVQEGIEAFRERMEVARKVRQKNGETGESPIKAARERHELDEALKARMDKRLGAPSQKVVKGD